MRWVLLMILAVGLGACERPPLPRTGEPRVEGKAPPAKGAPGGTERAAAGPP